MGLAESINDWKVREKGGDKLQFYPKAPEPYFPVFSIFVPEITKKY